MSDLLKFRYRPLHKLRFLRSPRLIVKACRDAFQIEAYRLRRLRPLLKDPIALMSADWLQATFGLKVILAVRHPAAFVESMKRQRDSHPWSDFIQQAALMDNELQGYAEQILAAEAGYLSSLEQHILLWNILYGFVRLKLSQGHDWIVVRHEDLSRDPAEEFRSLYKQVGLSYTSDIKSRLLADRMSGISDKWKTCLQKSEIRAVRIGTEHVWQGRFYADSDWV